MKRLVVFLVLIFVVSAIAQTPAPAAKDPWVYGSGANTWDPSWNNRPDPAKGACFYTAITFQGNHFCVRSGDKLPDVPDNLGGNVASIKIINGVVVHIYNESNYQDGVGVIRRSIADLRTIPFRNGLSWNNRTLSLTVK